MTTRILPPAEYGRLEGTELEAIAPILPAGSAVVVVEDGDRIVACWALLPLVHVEGCWIDPAYRGNPRVAARLLRGMTDTAAALGARTVLTAALTPEVEGLIGKLGGEALPGRHFVVNVDCARTKIARR